MKKTLIVLSALLALVACNKETPSVQNDGTIDASKVVFNLTINYADDTKAVKSGWSDGDKVFLFFEGVTTGYVVTEYDGSAWTPTLKGTATLSASGKKVTAVFLPFSTDEPTYDGAWKFAKKTAYYMTAEAQEYTVTTDPSTDLSTLSATLDMENSQEFVQILISDASPIAGAFMMYAEGLIPTWCESIVPGGSVIAGTATAGLPIEPEIVDGEGYYFYGTVSSSITDPTFYIVEQDPTDGYAIGTRVKSITGGKSLAPKAAVKFSTLPDIEPWVDLGLTSGLKWATGNLSNSGIVAPTEYGQYYAWGETTGYDYDTTHNFDGSEYVFNASTAFPYDEFTKYNSLGATLESIDDAAYVITGGEFRIPTTSEMQAFCSECGNGLWTTSLGILGQAFTGPNGLVVFFPASGYISPGGGSDRDSNGSYWSSSLSDWADVMACYLFFYMDEHFESDGSVDRCYGLSVRPVKD